MKFTRSLNGHVEKIKPIWLMRQAGRYLPEYRKLRSKFSDFMRFCFNREAVIESTLQPIKRFEFDAAIIFSDILVIPDFLGQKVFFKEGVGPILEKPDWQKILKTSAENKAQIIYESITDVRRELDSQKALIGFVGCPWTVASYMISGGKTKNFAELINFVRDWPLFESLIGKLVGTIADHAIGQLRAGADVVQLFESWAAEVPVSCGDEWLFAPTKRIIESIRAEVPGAGIIYYAKGRASEAMKRLAHLNIGFGVSHEENLGKLGETGICLQGNLSPQKLLDGDFEQDTLKILDFARDRPFIVNLGHGILPQTPIENVERFVELVRCQK